MSRGKTSLELDGSRPSSATGCAMKPWPKVRLGEVLRRSQETIEPQADGEYREITVRLWGNGVVERGRVLGASLSGRRFVAQAGQFIASCIDARNDAMGLVPPAQLAADILKKEQRIGEIMGNIQKLLAKQA